MHLTGICILACLALANAWTASKTPVFERQCKDKKCQCVDKDDNAQYSGLTFPATEKYNCRKKPTLCQIRRFGKLLANDWAPRCNKRGQFVRKQCEGVDLCDPLPINSITCGNVKIGAFSKRTHFFDNFGNDDNDDKFGITRNPTEFTIVAGLDGGEGTISFQDADDSEMYLRHFDNILYMESIVTGRRLETFNNDASFKIHWDKFENGYVAFESVNFVNCFIRHIKDTLYIELDNKKNREDATWKIIPTGQNVPEPDKTCWCVDRVGDVIDGTKKKKDTDCPKKRKNKNNNLW